MTAFKETQRFPRTWILVILILTAPIFILMAFRALNGFMVSQWDPLIWFSLIIIPLVIIFMNMIRMTTHLDETGIEVQFYPIHRKPRFFSWSEIRSAEVRKYRPLWEYGGWGIRIGPKGKAYNISGKQGLQLVFRNGKQLLIGTQQPSELQDVIDEISRKRD